MTDTEREANDLKQDGYKAPTVVLAWMNKDFLSGVDRDDLVYYGGVERIPEMGRHDEARALQEAMDRIMIKVEAMIREPIEGGAFANLPIEVSAVFGVDTDDIIITYRVPFEAAATKH